MLGRPLLFLCVSFSLLLGQLPFDVFQFLPCLIRVTFSRLGGLFGYGIDHLVDRDLKGSMNSNGANGVNLNVQYLSDQRTYVTTIHPVWEGLITGFEWQHFWTNRAQPTSLNSQKFQADMFTLFAWYNFYLSAWRRKESDHG